MHEEPLKLRFFGGFSIKSTHHELTVSTSSGSQIALLIAFLISNGHQSVSKNMLIEALWPRDAAQRDMTGALRTLIYRTRKELSLFFPHESREYIKFSHDTYFWNTELPYETDTDAFDALSLLFKSAQDSSAKYAHALQMAELYTGDYLPNHTNMEFVLFRSIYFRNQYVLAARFLCEYEYRAERYSEVIARCDATLLLFPQEESLYMFKINAYLALGQADQAMDYYHTVTTTFTSKFGLELSASFYELYNKIIAQLPMKKQDLETLESALNENSPDKNAFYCDYYMFRNFYQISRRSVNRSFATRFLALFTLQDIDAPDILSENLRQSMTVLFRLIQNNLRQNDIFSRTSEWQYSAILAVPNEVGAQAALRRLEKQFTKMNYFANIRLHSDLKRIE